MSRTLADSVDANAPELVKYIPQSYLEVICSELEASGDTQFDRELREVIYSHVDEVDRLGYRTLSDLLEYLTDEKETRIEHLKLDLGRVNGEIEKLEDMHREDYRKSLEAQLEQRKAELAAHEANRPAEILKPEQDPDAVESMKKISAEMAELKARSDGIAASIQQQQQALRAAAARIASASRLLDRVDNLERAISGFFADSTEDEQTLGIDLRKLVAVGVDRVPIERIRDEAEVVRRTTRSALSPDVEDSLERQQQAISVELESLRSEFDGPAREYQQYLHEMEQWDSARDEIIGSELEPSTVVGLETRIARLTNLPAQIESMKAERFGVVREIFAVKEELLEEYRKLYQPVQDFIDNHPISQQSDALQFSATISEDGFADQFLDFIHQGRIGSFQRRTRGTTYSESKLSRAISRLRRASMFFWSGSNGCCSTITETAKSTPRRFALNFGEISLRARFTTVFMALTT